MENKDNFIKQLLQLIEQKQLQLMPAVAAVADFNVELKGYPRIIDGVTVTRNYRVLLIGQTNPKENGIYVLDKVWKKEESFKEGTKLKRGMMSIVADGLKYGKGYCVLLADAIVGKNDLTFYPFKVTYTPEEEQKFAVNGTKYNKKCFGNFMENENGCRNHNGCEVQDQCFSETSTKKGPCDCPYKAGCHIPRQQLQDQFRKEYGDKPEDCDFYKMVEERKQKETK